MNIEKGKFAWMVKIGEKGQFVIPKEARDLFLSGVVDINFYKEAESYYSVGIKGSGMNTKIIRAPHLYKIDVIAGQNIMGEILSTLSVTFVKYKSFTVLPYPIKYLNEYIQMLDVVTKDGKILLKEVTEY